MSMQLLIIRIAVGLICTAVMSIGTIQLIKYFESIDKELNTVVSSKDKLIIIILSIIVGFLSTIALWNRELDIITNTVELFNISILFIYLALESYTDQKTKLVYSSVSIIMIPIEILYVVYMVISGNSQIYGIYTLAVLFIPVVLFILSLFRGIGLGDVLIYLVISIYYIGAKEQVVVSMLFNVIASNILFIITSLIYRLVKHNKEKHQPLTIFISIVTILFSILKI